jgi:peptidoglycan LD-endopeptidase CwlK
MNADFWDEIGCPLMKRRCMWSRRIEDLIPDMQPVAQEFIKKCTEAGHEVVITCTLRNQAVQDVLYMQGREPLDVVNAARKTVGLWSLLPSENFKPVTWSRTSKHVADSMSDDPIKRKSLALDFAIRGKDYVLIWNPKVDIDGNNIPDYEECGGIAESLGLFWGGRWKTPDFSHIEWALSPFAHAT